jgi:NAD-dependent DNA ligase
MGRMHTARKLSRAASIGEITLVTDGDSQQAMYVDGKRVLEGSYDSMTPARVLKALGIPFDEREVSGEELEAQGNSFPEKLQKLRDGARTSVELERFDNLRVQAIVEKEGLEDAVRSYLTADQIKDPDLAADWKRLAEVLSRLEREVGKLGDGKIAQIIDQEGLLYSAVNFLRRGCSKSRIIRDMCAEVETLQTRIEQRLDPDQGPEEAISLKGKTIVFTGTFSAKRDEMKRLAEEKGATVRSALSDKVDFLVAGDKPSKRKLARAEELGVVVMNARAFSEIASAAESRE